jgi:hypothetical protein
MLGHSVASKVLQTEAIKIGVDSGEKRDDERLWCTLRVVLSVSLVPGVECRKPSKTWKTKNVRL